MHSENHCVSDSAVKYTATKAVQGRICESHENEMLHEKYRIESFQNWPVPYINVRELAANGFYYTGCCDVVECRFCRLRLNNWEADDDVVEQHNKFASYCPFLRFPEKTENVKMNKKILLFDGTMV